MPLLLNTSFAFLFFIVAFRCLLLALFEKKPAFLRFLDLLLGVVFALCGWSMKATLPMIYNIASLLIGLVLAGLILLPAIRRINIPYKSRPGIALLKAMFIVCALVLFIALLMVQGFLRVYEDHPVLKITMTGMQRQEDVQWKPPEFPFQHQKLTAYEVVVNQPDGKPISQFYLYGDEVAVKARVIRFRPSLAMLGVRSLCKIEYVFNGYTTAERHNFYPHRAIEIPVTSPALKPWQERFWGYWEKLYYHEGSNALVKTATLESTFFPLVDAKGQPYRGAYYLTVNPGGLSGISAGD